MVAERGDGPAQLVGRQVGLGAGHQQALEQQRGAAAQQLAFKQRTGAHRDPDLDRRRAVVLLDDQGQAARQDLAMDALRLRASDTGRGQQQREDQRQKAAGEHVRTGCSLVCRTRPRPKSCFSDHRGVTRW